MLLQFKITVFYNI